MSKTPLDPFQCWYCEKNLTDQRYIIKNNFAICLSCFQEKYANYCYQCNQIIPIETPGNIFQNKTWHKTCFNCSICTKNLINTKFAYKNEKLYCRDCFINEYAERCYRCNQTLKPGDKCTQYDEKLYHKTCFICHSCQNILQNANFRRRDQYFLCLSCHYRLAAIYCIKCHKAIVNQGILYHNHPFHDECFLCTYCSIPLRTQRYIEYNNDAYCTNCSLILFNKRRK